MELALTADPSTAEQAHGYGLVSGLAEKGESLAVAIDLAERIAKNALLGVAASKQLVHASLDATEEEFWAIQAPFMGQVFTSNDAKEGPRSSTGTTSLPRSATRGQSAMTLAIASQIAPRLWWLTAATQMRPVSTP